MHSYFANLYEIECASQHYHRTLESISIWDITKCLGENVCHLLICLYVLQPNGLPLNAISQEVVHDVYVFASVVEHWIFR